MFFLRAKSHGNGRHESPESLAVEAKYLLNLRHRCPTGRGFSVSPVQKTVNNAIELVSALYFQRLKLRGLIAKMSAACVHFNCPLIALRITS